MNIKIRSEEIYEAYQKALDEKFNPTEKIYLSAPKYVLLNKGLFKHEFEIEDLFGDEYMNKHDEFITILVDNREKLDPSPEKSLALFILAYCRFQEYLGWINKEESIFYMDEISKELQKSNRAMKQDCLFIQRTIKGNIQEKNYIIIRYADRQYIDLDPNKIVI